MYSQLGSIIFEGRRGFTAFSSSRETNFAEHALIENKPRLQRVGTNLETIEVSMLFDISFCDPQEEYEKLDSSRENGEILPLIMGDGTFVGEFVIKSVKVTNVHDADNGRRLQSEVSVSLLEYYDSDRETTSSDSAIALAFANPDNNPSLFIPEEIAQTVESAAASSVVAANAAASTAGGILTEISYVEIDYRPKAETVIQKMLTVGDELNTVLEIINADPASEIYARTRDLEIKIGVMLILVNDVILECQALIADIDANNTLDIPGRIATLTDKGTEVNGQAKALSASAASLTALVVIQ